MYSGQRHDDIYTMLDTTGQVSTPRPSKGYPTALRLWNPTLKKSNRGMMSGYEEQTG